MHTIRSEKELDYDNLQRIHNRFEFFKDPDNMEDRWRSERDLKDEDYETLEDVLTTELSDPEAMDIYRRYKTMIAETKVEVESIRETELKIIQ